MYRAVKKGILDFTINIERYEFVSLAMTGIFE